MAEFPGIENVDPEQRQAQRALTEALWSKLEEQGVDDRTAGRIECQFYAKDIAAVRALLPAFPGWERNIGTVWERNGGTVDDAPGELSITLVSPLVHLSREAFLELVDVALIAARQSSCVFDGFQVDMSTLVKRPWWRFW